MRLLATCDLCEEPFRDDTDRHTMRTDTAELTIHKACAMQLFRGVWDRQEELVTKGLMTGGTHPDINTSICLVCHDPVYEGPTVKLDGLSFVVHEGCYSQYAYTDTPVLAHKGLMKKGAMSMDSLIDVDAQPIGTVLETNGEYYVVGWERALQPYEPSQQQLAEMKKASK